MAINHYEIQAIVVRQWLKKWDGVRFIDEKHRRKPEPDFYLFSLPALYLKKLSAVYSRKAEGRRNQDMAIQRLHDKPRSEEIRRFIHGGFPWSDLSERQKSQNGFSDLRMPGWLPTAIVANILPPNAERGSSSLKEKDSIKIEHLKGTGLAKIILPKGFDSEDWEPSIPPIEIIDGQHRLFAFESEDILDGDFYLPVVAFYDLDITWQAYLFYTINIKPKKINTSLAYDLYPLLRVQEWLEKSPNSGPVVYRETRAQELTEALWSHPESPWKSRINMLGEKRGGDVTQAAFIRSLMTSYVKRGSPIGGLFGDELTREKNNILHWSRIQQAAFLIVVWKEMKDAVNKSKEPWAEDLRGGKLKMDGFDFAFAGNHSLLATDQGVRGILQVTNDMCFLAAEDIQLEKWIENETSEGELEESIISAAIGSLKAQPVNNYLKRICRELAKFDWRTSSAPEVAKDDNLRRQQMVFKGSSGYKELRKQLIEKLCSSEDQQVSSIALKVKKHLRD